MITIAPETDEETAAVGAMFARAGGPDKAFPGCQVQVLRVEPGMIAAHGARYGGGQVWAGPGPGSDDTRLAARRAGGGETRHGEGEER